jgi:hypothetical protein
MDQPILDRPPIIGNKDRGQAGDLILFGTIDVPRSLQPS